MNGKWGIINSSGVRSFGIIGTADERYETAKPFLPKDSIIVDGADHGMEVSHDPVRSIEILKNVTKATEEWLLA